MIGTFGKINFEASTNKIFTPDAEVLSAQCNIQTKDSSKGKPSTSKITPGLRSYKFKVFLSSALGIEVQDVMDLWMSMSESGSTEYMNMGGKPLSTNMFTLKSASFSNIKRNGDGVPTSAEMSLDFQENTNGVAAKKAAKKGGKRKKKSGATKSTAAQVRQWCGISTAQWELMPYAAQQSAWNSYDATHGTTH